MLWTLKARLAKLHKSLTIWVNATLLPVLLYLPEIKGSLPELQPYITPETYKVLAVVLVVANILLRIKTTKALEQK